MNVASGIDTALDRSVVLGYANIGIGLRRRLPGWPPDPPRMDGKVVLVTGAGSGLGLAAAVGFAALGASVRSLGRSATRAFEAAELAREQVPGADIRPVACDLSSLDALHEFVREFTAGEERLDVLVNNAGVMPEERTASVDGVELTFATHVLAPWVLTEGLAPLLARSAPARVINVTSGGQYGQAIPAGDIESTESSYGAKTFYARTKRELVVITEQWAEQLADSGVHVHAMHPGWADTEGVRQWMPVFRMLTRPFIRSVQQGADTIVWLGASPEGVAATGLLWQDRRPRPLTYAIGPGPDPAAARAEVWAHTAALAHGRLRRDR